MTSIFTSRYCAFDLEVAADLPDGSDWAAARPLGISCAALYTVTLDGDERHVSSSVVAGTPITPESPYPRQMTPGQCRLLAYRLSQLHRMGFTLVTYNGLGFDLDVLAEECQNRHVAERLRAVARSHIDIAFAFFADNGFMPSLSNAAAGMHLGGKLDGVSGADAPRLWAGSREDQDLVLKYVEQDARLTGHLYEAITKLGYLRWLTRAGKQRVWHPPERRIMNVEECMALPVPDVSWMDNPWPREKFTAWLEG